MKEELSNIGLSKYEIECYLCLLEFGNQKGNEIANKTNIPRTSTYPTLEKLDNKKFIYKIQENPKIYKAIKPKIAIESYIERQSNLLKEKGKLAIDKLTKIKKESKEEIVKLYFGKEQSHRSAKINQDKIKKEHLVISSDFNRNSLLKFSKKWIEMSNDKIDIYLIMPYKRKEESILSKLKQAGINIGFYNFNNLSFTISDRRRASIGVKSEKLEGGRIVVSINHKDFALNQAKFFFDIWKKSEKY